MTVDGPRSPVEGSDAARFPFACEELAVADSRVDSLFRRSFGAPAPSMPRHFVAYPVARSESVVAYVHYIAYRPGLYLLGGLCVDSRVYKTLSPAERDHVAVEGSLARWTMKRSIALLGDKRAVFGYTGDARSRRDILALGFVLAAEPYLYVQWHSEQRASRPEVIAEVAALGPF